MFNKKVSNVFMDNIINILEENKSNFNYTYQRKSINSSIIKVFVKTSDRISELKKILTFLPNATQDSNKNTHIIFNDNRKQRIEIKTDPSIKPVKKKTISGVENEYILTNLINSLITKNNLTNGINIKFTDGEHCLLCYNVIGASQCGKETTGRQKADVKIHTLNDDIPISLKKENAENWESPDKLLHEYGLNLLQNALEKGLTSLEMLPKSTNTARLTKEISVTDENLVKDVCFGSDILDKGCIIKHNFYSDMDIEQEKSIDGTIFWVFNVHMLLKTVDDVNNALGCYILLRNDSSRLGLNPIFNGNHVRGIRIVACYAKRGKKKEIFL